MVLVLCCLYDRHWRNKKRKILLCFLPSHSPIRAFTKCHLKIRFFKIRFHKMPFKRRTQKIQGQGQDQGQPFRETDPLKAKDRNARGQGERPRTHAASVLQKKSHQNFFSRDLQNLNDSKNNAVIEPIIIYKI